MNIVELETTDSTNNVAKELAQNGAASGTIVWAHAQTAGRGRQGNQWVSIPGNLFMSMILRPKASVENIGQISFLTAIALAMTLEKIISSDAEVHVKWPNDILINQKKASGILIETEGHLSWLVIGIGVNITNAPEGATCLYEAGIKTHTARQILELLDAQINTLVQQWEKDGFAPIRAAWLKRAYKLGESITARLPKETLVGVFDGIDHSGALLLKMPDATIKNINSGEVFL